MKFQDEFIKFLTTDFRSPKTLRPYSEKAAHDIISRLRRVEKILSVDIDEIVSVDRELNHVRKKVRDAASSLGATTTNPYGYNDAMNALRRYREFVVSRDV